MSGTGNIAVTAGQVNATTVAVGDVNVSGGVFSASGDFAANNVTVKGALNAGGGVTANNVTVSQGGTLHTTGSVAVATSSSINTGGTLQTEGGTYTGAPVGLNGGVFEAKSGATDLSAVNIVGAAKTSTVVNNALLARIISTGATGSSLYPANTDAGIQAALTLPGIEKPITSALSFAPTSAADAAISNFFGGANTGSRFTLAFVGDFTAPVTGIYQAQIAQVDDIGGILDRSQPKRNLRAKRLRRQRVDLEPGLLYRWSGRLGDPHRGTEISDRSRGRRHRRPIKHRSARPASGCGGDNECHQSGRSCSGGALLLCHKHGRGQCAGGRQRHAQREIDHRCQRNCHCRNLDSSPRWNDGIYLERRRVAHHHLPGFHLDGSSRPGPEYDS